MWNFSSYAFFIWYVLLQFSPVPYAHVPPPLFIFLLEQNLFSFKTQLKCYHENVLCWSCLEAMPTFFALHMYLPDLSYSTCFFFSQYSDFILSLLLDESFLEHWITRWLIFVPLQPPDSTGYSVHSEYSKNIIPLDAKESNT